jgi:hypothetical protein
MDPEYCMIGCCELQGSKSVQKRRREDEEQMALQKEAKKQRQQLSSRNRKAVLPKGHDPAQDAREKTLMTVATKYVSQTISFKSMQEHEHACWPETPFLCTCPAQLSDCH